MHRLCEYPWPGNVRELENLLERAVILANSDTLEIDQRLLEVPPTEPVSIIAAMAPSSASLEDFERSHILAVLNQTNWVIEGAHGAAKILDLRPRRCHRGLLKLRCRTFGQRGAMNPACTPSVVPPNFTRASSKDRELVSRLQAGDAEAYETLVREFGPRMLAIARRFLPCPHDSADAVQDAFISAFQSIQSFQEQSSLATWLHRITVNACLMALRSRGRRKSTSLDELLPQFDESGHHAQRISRWDDTVLDVVTHEQRALVRSCIDRVPEPYRSVLHLRDIEELDTEQTAQLLGTSTGNIKTRLHRARQMLRTLMQSCFDSAEVAV